MPNWCFGCLKARGTKGNLISFLDNGISMMKFSTTENNNVVVNKDTYKLDDENDGEYYELEWQAPSHAWLYIKDTNQAFVNDECYWHASRLMKINNNWFLYFPINQAWDYRTKDWEELSEKYNIDFRFYGIESGIGFTRDVEIINGHAEIDLTSRHQLSDGNYYEDFIWECPFPELGG